MNQKAKVTSFFLFFFDRNQPMTQPSAGKNIWSGMDGFTCPDLYSMTFENNFFNDVTILCQITLTNCYRLREPYWTSDSRLLTISQQQKSGGQNLKMPQSLQTYNKNCKLHGVLALRMGPELAVFRAIIPQLWRF